MADNETTAKPVGTQYTSHPISNYRLGRFKFVNGILNLTDETDLKEFESLLADKRLPERERARIQKIDVARAEAIVRERLANERKITQTTDSSVGDAHRNSPKVGTGDLADSGKEPLKLDDGKPVNPLAGLGGKN